MNLTNEQINNYYLNAIEYFNKTHPEWLCTIEQGFLVIQLNHNNSTFYNGLRLTETTSTYRCVVKIMKNGKFLMTDVYVTDGNSVGLAGLQLSSTAFAGKSIEYHYETSKEGEYKFSTLDIQKPVKEYFKSLGLKYKFYSYKFSLQALPKVLRIVTVILPLFVGCLFIPLSFVFDENIGTIAFLTCGCLALLWGILNLVMLLKKDE